LGGGRGQFLGRGGPAVRSDVIEDAGHLLVAQRMQQVFLLLDAEILEDFGARSCGRMRMRTASSSALRSVKISAISGAGNPPQYLAS